MTKIIKLISIDSCNACPNRHLGYEVKDKALLGQLLPSCTLVEPFRKLPHTVEVSARFPQRQIAVPTGVIPDWCPLEELPRPAPAVPTLVPFEFKRADDTEGGSCD